MVRAVGSWVCFAIHGMVGLTSHRHGSTTRACVAPPKAEEEGVLYMWSREKKDGVSKGVKESKQMYCPYGRGIVLRQAHVGKGLTLYDVFDEAKKLLPSDHLTNPKQYSDWIKYDSLVNNHLVPSDHRSAIEAARLVSLLYVCFFLSMLLHSPTNYFSLADLDLWLPYRL